MKEKKGFTLVELLAVLVVLAIIAVIVSPIVVKIINDARESADERSIEAYAHSLKQVVAQWQLANKGETPPGDLKDIKDDQVREEINKLKINKTKGEVVTCEHEYVLSSGKLKLTKCSTETSKKDEKYYDFENNEVFVQGSERDVIYALYKVGNIVKLKNKDGNTVEFYVINDIGKHSDYVTLMKKTPLSYKEAYSIAEENGITNTSFNGENKVQMNDNNGYGSYNFGETNNYDSSYVKNIINIWQRKNFNDNDLKEVDGYKARLITVDELIDDLHFGYVNDSGSTVPLRKTSSTPKWAYSPNYGYWTMTSVDYNNCNTTYCNDSYIWPVYSYGENYNQGSSPRYDSYTIRPVINLYKKAI